MKIVNWITYKPGYVSGMINFAFSMYYEMLRQGYDTYLCSTEYPDGKVLQLGDVKIRFREWKEAGGKDSINIFHCDIPPCVLKLKHRVFPIHGGPLHCFYEEYTKSDASLATAGSLLELSDLSVVWNPKHIQYWSEFTDPEKLVYVKGGIDLRKYSPNGDKTEFVSHPTVGYCDAIRLGIKQPFNLLFAIKKVARELPGVRLELINIPPEKSGFWHWLVGRLKLDVNCENIVVGIHPNLPVIYRGLDMLVHPISGGSMSSVGCEALACGCPTIILSGESYTEASAKCDDTPDSMAKAILKLWDRIQREGADKVRAEARSIAEKNYSIENTVKALIAAFESKLNVKVNKVRRAETGVQSN